MEQGKRYRVTGFSTLYPNETMTVWVDTVTDTTVTGHIRETGYPLVSVSTWPRDMANLWQWTEIVGG